MKWARKKRTPFSSSSSSSSTPAESMMSQAFSISYWLSKLTQNCGNFDKMGKHEGDSNPRCGTGVDDDAFWRISIGEDIERRLAYNNVSGETEDLKLRNFKKEEVESLGFDFTGGHQESLFSKPRCANPITAPDKELSFEWRRLKDFKIRELMTKNEEQKKLPRPQMHRAAEKKKTEHTHSRTDSKAESSRIGPKMKMKTVVEEDRGENEVAESESMAIVKSSLDPRKDFHDSMVEMITEKPIKSPRQLEELLACYLTLNSDEYHELIITVFRQVWHQINRREFHEPELLLSP